MLEIIRRSKLTYTLYNMFHRKELKQNEKLYARYGIKKKYYSPISSKDFEGKTLGAEDQTPVPEDIDFEKSRIFGLLDEESKNSLKSFQDTGYAVLRNYFSEEVDQVNLDIDDLLEKRVIRLKADNKINWGFLHSKAIKNIACNQDLQELLGTLLNGRPVLFQSINFKTGSQQATHSDAIHMTTYPLGGLLGVWVALEDITNDNGPVHYYPGSHKLPYYLNSDYDNEGSRFLIGDKSYRVYESMLRSEIEKLRLKKKIFTAKKGDVLIWHANLFHGGEPHHDKNQTRKSMVLHYIKKDSICYHELTQRPAVIRRFDNL